MSGVRAMFCFLLGAKLCCLAISVFSILVQSLVSRYVYFPGDILFIAESYKCGVYSSYAPGTYRRCCFFSIADCKLSCSGVCVTSLGGLKYE